MKILLLFLPLFLVSCGGPISKGGDNDPKPKGGYVDEYATPVAPLTPHISSFEARYNKTVSYTVAFDLYGETGGSGSAGKTVGVCRIWTSGHREILINKSWWIEQQQIVKSLSVSNGAYSGSNYTYNFGNLPQRKNAKINISLGNGTNNHIESESSITSSNNQFYIKSKSCSISGSGVQTCSVDLRFNMEENLTEGIYSTVISNGDRQIDISVNVEQSPVDFYVGEESRKILIWHEIGHCSFNRNHDCQTDKQNGVGVRCAGTNSSSDPGNFTHANSTDNKPWSIMYPTINPIVSWYMKDNYIEQDYYEDELEDNAQSSSPGSVAGSYSYDDFSQEEEVEHIHPHEGHGDCVQFVD